jgi:methylenetetrahydrofolate reductase (NADPH)
LNAGVTIAQPDPTENGVDAIRRLLADPIYELIPVKNAPKQMCFLPAGAQVSVTASPNKTLDDTLELSEGLAAQGFRAIPHLSARMTRDRDHLASLVDRARNAGIDRAFVIGGDAEQAGEFFDAEALLRALDEIGHPFSEIGVAGYPEGHHVVDEATAAAALRAKQRFATSVTTQMCFDGSRIVDWIAESREDGIAIPFELGIPGVVERVRLIKIAGRIGVGGSVKFLRSNLGVVRAYARPGRFTPEGLLESIGDALANPDAGVRGVHIYTFNQVETTEEWRQGYLASL